MIVWTIFTGYRRVREAFLFLSNLKKTHGLIAALIGHGPYNKHLLNLGIKGHRQEHRGLLCSRLPQGNEVPQQSLEATTRRH